MSDNENKTSLEKESKVKESVETKSPKVTKSIPKRVLGSIKRHKKRTALFIFTVIILSSLGAFYAITQSQDKPYYYAPAPTVADVKATILQVYDGDQTINPNISIFNRIVKVKVSFKSYNYIPLTATTREQVALATNGDEYYPINYQTLQIDGNSEIQKEFYFEIPRDFMPEALTITDDDLKGNIEIKIDTNAEYYSINESLKLVLDSESNGEYIKLEKDLKNLVEHTNELAIINLPNIDLTIKLPEINKVEFEEMTDEIVAGYGSSEESYYDGDRPNDYDYKNCLGIDPNSLQPTNEAKYCKFYTISYGVQTDTKLVGVSRYIYLYHNSYPESLTGSLGSHSDLNMKDVRLLGSDQKITEIIDEHEELYYIVFKADADNVYVIDTSKYLGYSDELPIEITTLEKQLMFNIFGTITFKKQDDVVTPKDEGKAVVETNLSEESTTETTNSSE